MTAAMYKVSLVLMLIQSAINTILNLLAVEFIYSNVTEIAGWNKNEMMILICSSLIINQFFRGLILPNHYNFVVKIGDGGFDNVLLKPIDLLFQLNTGKIDIPSFLSVSVPIILLIRNLNKVGVSVSAVTILIYIVLIICGITILSSFILLLNSLAFKFIKVDGLMNIYYIMMDISVKPKDIFSNKYIIGVFTLLIPAIPLANIPAAILLGKAKLSYAVVSIIISLILIMIVNITIRQGVKSYSSASS
jgi:ABC-2 type transport system permease protein